MADRREQSTKHFFQQLTHPDSCLTRLIPPKPDLSIHLRRTRLYELPKTRTVRYAKSFYRIVCTIFLRPNCMYVIVTFSLYCMLLLFILTQKQ